MYLTPLQTFIIIAAIALGTMLTRFLPFILFPEKKTPPAVCNLPWEGSSLCHNRPFGSLLHEGCIFYTVTLRYSGRCCCFIYFIIACMEEKYSA